MICCKCGRSLKGDDYGLNKKFLGRNCENFLCLSCLAKFLHCEDKDLTAKAEEFRKTGCCYFQKNE